MPAVRHEAKRVQNPLRRRGPGIGAAEDGGMIASGLVWGDVLMLATCTEEAVHRALAVRAESQRLLARN